MHFLTRPFLGHSETNSWSQYWENEPDDQSVFFQKGHLFALANLISDDSTPATELGHQLIKLINDSYFSSKSTITAALRESINHLVSHPDYQLADLTLFLAVIHQSQLYLCGYNSGICFVVRQGKISRILSGATGQTSQVSGKIVPGDRLFLCTSSFYDQLTEVTLHRYLAINNIREIEENIAPQLYQLSSQSNLAALLIGIDPDEEIIADNFTSVPDVPLEPSPIPPPPVAQPSVYVSHHDPSSQRRRRQFNILIAILLLIALGTSIYLGAKRNRAAQVEAQYQELKTQYQQKIDNAQAVKNINLQEAQKLAQSAKEIAARMSALQVHLDEISGFNSTVSTILSQTGSADSYQPDNYYDTTLISSSANYNRFLSAKNTLYLLDRSAGRLDKLDISTKSQQKVNQNDRLKSVDDFTESSGQLYFLSSAKIFSYDNGNFTEVSDLSKNIPNISSGRLHSWNGALYLLADNSLWKLTASGSVFSSPQSWLKEGTTLPSSVTAFAINGQVWTLTKNGQIIPYNRGEKSTFKSSVTATLSNADHLVTALDSTTLAFVEDNHLVYIYRKDGSAASSYNFGNRQVLDLALDPDGSRLFVLCSDHKIYQIHL